MSVIQFKFRLHNELIFKFSKLNRIGLAKNYINGNGIEIGALNKPLRIPNNASVKYLDRISAYEHLNLSKEYKLKDLVKVDIIGDGEVMSNVDNNSQDFVIANHFIEHCQNPIATIENMLRVLRKDGIIFMAIPDKRFTFDIKRNITTNEHLIKDYKNGPAWSEYEHYFDFVKNTEWSDKCKNDEDIKKVIQHLKEINWSIHFHVWTHTAMIDFFQIYS